MCSINPKLSLAGSQSLALPFRKGARTTIASRTEMHSVYVHVLAVCRCRLFLFLDLAGHGHNCPQIRIVLATFTFKMILTLRSFTFGPAKRLEYCAASVASVVFPSANFAFCFLAWRNKRRRTS
ncbi:unnamed protein product [Ixodes pacificus]